MIDVTENARGKVNFNIPAFRRALGCLRLLLKVGMGKEEEQVLRKCLRSVKGLKPTPVVLTDNVLI